MRAEGARPAGERGEARRFLNALAFGDRTGLTPSLWNDFQKTGTAHLIAISGQHVALVVSFFYLLILWGLKRSVRLMLTLSVKRAALLLSLPVAVAYVLVAGSPPSAVRALIMLAVGVFAYWLRRDFDIYSALALAAILLVSLDRSTLFSASFQLSFLAVLGIALLTSPLSKRFLSDPEKTGRLVRWTLLALLATLSATLATAPLVAYRFQIVSLSGVLTNLWAVPACGLLLGITFLSQLLSLLLPFLAKTLTIVPEEAARLFLYLIHQSASWSLTLELYPRQSEVILSYLLLGLFVLSVHRKLSLIRSAGTATALILIFFLWGSLGSKGLSVTMLDVGQGDAIVIRTPHRRTILMDGGGFLIPGRPVLFDVGREVVLPSLRREGVREIDLMILSHPHPDHYGGLTAIAESLPVREFWWNGQTFPDPTFDRLQDTLTGKTEEVAAGFKREIDGVLFEILYPEKVKPSLGMNNNCLVLSLKYGETRFLFAGDIERKAEEILIRSGRNLKADLLKIPHHGSRTSSSIPFIEAVSPRFAVASLGEGNMFQFPNPGVLEKYQRRGIQVYRTDLHGAVRLLSDGKRVVFSK